MAKQKLVRVHYKNFPAPFRELRTLPGVKAELLRKATAIANAAGDGFQVGEVRETGGRGRAHVTVAAYTRRAQYLNAKHHTLMNLLSSVSNGGA